MLLCHYILITWLLSDICLSVEDVVAGHEPKKTEEKDAVSEVPLTEEDLVRTDHNMTVIRHTNPDPEHDANEGFRPVGPLK